MEVAFQDVLRDGMDLGAYYVDMTVCSDNDYATVKRVYKIHSQAVKKHILLVNAQAQ